MKTYLIVFASMLFSLNAKATSWSADHVYLTKIHYSLMAFDKPVSQVMAHLGVASLTSPEWMGSSREYWQDVVDVDLERDDDAFTGYVRLYSKSGKFGPIVHHPVVQYWVTFEDGTQRVSPVFEIPVSNSIQFSAYLSEDPIAEFEAPFVEQPTLGTEAAKVTFVRIH